jgi:four helix bundle protein
MAVRDFRDLVVWQRARELAGATHRLTAGFPADERFGLTPQMRRASVSVMANIAEGNGRLHRAEYRRFLSTANGSLRELQSHLMLARDLGYVDARIADETFAESEHVRRMLRAMLTALAKPAAPP